MCCPHLWREGLLAQPEPEIHTSNMKDLFPTPQPESKSTSYVSTFPPSSLADRTGTQPHGELGPWLHPSSDSHPPPWTALDLSQRLCHQFPLLHEWIWPFPPALRKEGHSVDECCAQASPLVQWPLLSAQQRACVGPDTPTPPGRGAKDPG